MSRRQDGRHSRTAGFTLLELMLALALLAVLMVLLYGAFHAVAESKLSGEARLKSDSEGRALLWMLCRDLRGAVYTPMLPSHVLLIGQAVKQGGSPLDSITVSTLSLGHQRALTGFGSESLVTYSSAPNPEHRGWYELLRAEQSALIPLQNNQLPNSSGPLAAAAAPVVMASDVVGLHLRYFNGSQWLETWDSTVAPPGQFLPQAIEIELQLAAGRRTTHLSTIISVPMAVIQR